jgi:hypothetical protein
VEFVNTVSESTKVTLKVMTTTQSISELLAHILKTYCNINYMTNDWHIKLLQVLNHPDFPNKEMLFRQQLADAILNHSITPEQYESLTDEEFETTEELEERLREIWHDLYGNEPVVLG